MSNQKRICVAVLGPLPTSKECYEWSKRNEPSFIDTIIMELPDTPAVRKQLINGGFLQE